MMDGGSMLDLATNVGQMLDNRRGYNGDGYGDGIFGGNGIWLLVILFFIMGAGNGFGNWGNRGNMNELTNEFLFTNLNTKLDTAFAQLANQNWNIERQMCQDTAMINANIAENRFAAEKCCCETKEQIMQNRYENARNTCDIITAGTANTQRILDFLNNEKIDSLRTELQAAQLQLGNLSQTNTLLNALRPFPQPAYITCSPYQSANIGLYGGYNGYNNGCGFNNVNLV